ncbi:MAG: ornithine carbamoyltransferase, partial [Candidatus Nanohaloarchaea archaeon]
SMGQDADRAAKLDTFAPFQVDQDLMDAAAEDAVFMHCLPAHHGEEVTAGVIDGDDSVVYRQAENRMHMQKAILLTALA